MKSLLFKLPEYCLLLIVLLATYSPPFTINPFFVGVVMLLVFQIIFQNRVLGFVLGMLFFLVNLFFLGALLSEFREFTEFNNAAKQLLVVGLLIWIMNIVLSSTMMYKYAMNKLSNNNQMKLEKQNI